MSPLAIRWMLAAIVTVALGSAILGVGQGDGGGSAPPSSTEAARARTAVATLGPVGERGREVFDDNNCAGCHRLSDAGSSGTIGPDLDTAITGATLAELRQDIVDPEAQGTPGFPTGRMPDGYDRISDADLDALVRYLQAASSGK